MKKLVIVVAFLFSTGALVAQLTQPSNGNIGIGVPSPTAKLDVALPGLATQASGIRITAPANYQQGSTITDLFHIRKSGLTTGTFVPLFSVHHNGKVSIGLEPTTANLNGDYRLFVAKGIMTEKVKVAWANSTDWADYVFEEKYHLMPLAQLEDFVGTNKHLPNIPSAKEVSKNGFDLAQMDCKLLEKIEELTLYVIEQQKQITALEAQIKTVKP
jgi:hypothetical protein